MVILILAVGDFPLYMYVQNLKPFILFCFFRSNTTVKIVVVLGGKEGVSGTVYFTQDGDANLISIKSF